jgi:hypothetical protein
MENQRISRRQLGGIHDNLEGVRCSRISSGTPRFVRENTLAECTRGEGSASFAVVSRIHVVHRFRPLRCVSITRPSTTEDLMVNGAAKLQIAVRYGGGYSEKVRNLSELVQQNQGKTGETSAFVISAHPHAHLG